jgi:hypothetical protein
MVGTVVALNSVTWSTFEPVLADNHRSFFSFFQALWDQENPISNEVGEYVQDDLVTGPFRLVVDLS